MALKEDFKKHWDSEFQNVPLPALRYLNSRNSGERLNNLNLDLDDLKKKQRELQEELYQVNFSYDWISAKKSEEEKEAIEEKGEYYNVNEGYCNVQPGSSMPKPTPRLGAIGRATSAPEIIRSHSDKKDTAAFNRIRDAMSMNLKLGRPDDIYEVKSVTQAKRSPNTEVLDDDLRQISQKIDKTFKSFGREVLEFSPQEIEMCERLSDTDNKRAHRMLLKWKRRLGRRATTSTLLELLKRFGYDSNVWGFLEDSNVTDTQADTNKHQLTEIIPEVEPYPSTVIEDYITSARDELSVKKGDTVMIQDTGQDGWYFGEFRGARGWIPRYCVTEESSTGSSGFLFVVEALVDRSLPETGFLKFKSGDLLDIIEEQTETSACYRGRNRSGYFGLIATKECRRVLFRKKSVLSERDWFHPTVTRRQAEELLRLCAPGTFLIREASKEPGNFVLSVKSGDEIANFMITAKHDGYKIYNREFQSLQEIIDYHKRNVIRDRLFLTAALP